MKRRFPTQVVSSSRQVITKPPRARSKKRIIDPNVATAFDVFGSDLSDEAFAGIFDQERSRSWRKIDL
jgi:hypothetical protein